MTTSKPFVVTTTLDTGHPLKEGGMQHKVTFGFDTEAEALAFCRGCHEASEQTNGWLGGRLETEFDQDRDTSKNHE